jgi:hypothetical protein
MEAAAMRAIKPVTPDEAARVWRSIPDPSTRKVAKTLTQAGRRVHFSTIARWRAQGWRPVVSGLHPIEAARDALDRAARLLTGDLPLGADTLVRQSEAGDQLASLNDVELLRRLSRELLIRQIGLCKIMNSRGVLLIRDKPAEAGEVLKAPTLPASPRALSAMRVKGGSQTAKEQPNAVEASANPARGNLPIE